MLILSKNAPQQDRSRSPKVLLVITTGHDGLFMLDERYEWEQGRTHPVDESPNSDYLYQAALARRETLRAAGFNVAVDVKVRGW